MRTRLATAIGLVSRCSRVNRNTVQPSSGVPAIGSIVTTTPAYSPPGCSAQNFIVASSIFAALPVPIFAKSVNSPPPRV